MGLLRGFIHNYLLSDAHSNIKVLMGEAQKISACVVCGGLTTPREEIDA